MDKRMGAIGLLGVLAACGTGPEAKLATDEPGGKSESAERIDAQNDPNRFQLDLSRRHADLPAAGTSLRKPFPSNWWPMRTGGIARRWNGANLSPAEKYDQLVTPDRVRDVQLTLAQKNWKDEPANTGAQPETFHVGPAAEWELRNHGRYGAQDPDSWWGHCNGWSSYVLNEDEPTRPVTARLDATQNRVVECASASEAGCVRFGIGDINALGTELYWSDGARMLGRRCSQEASELTFDASGRINAVECRDGNAGAFHIVATNMLGRLNRPFVVDLSTDFQVWNYPVYRYELSRNEEIPLAQALVELNAPTSTTTWTFNPSAVRWVRVAMKAWMVEDAIPPNTQPSGAQLDRYTSFEYYDYILELDASGTILGGEWVGSSKTRHPDFVWYSFSNSAYSAASDDTLDGDNPSLRYSYWKQLLTLSQRTPESTGGGATSVLRLSKDAGAAIPDNDPNGVTSTIDVTESFTPTAVRASVNVTHTYVGDLVVSLEHAGRTVTLRSLEGGSAHDLVASFDVSGLDGSATGAWILHVSDRAGQDVGTLVSWTLELTRPASTGGGGGGTGGGATTPLHLSATPSAAIPDNLPAGVSSVLEATESFAASSVRVSVNLQHTYRGDLRVSLVHGDRTVVLHDRTGGSVDDLVTTFDVASLVGQDVRGAWTLLVVDTAKADVGTLRSWSLELGRPATTGGGTGGGTTVPPTPVTREYAATPALAIPDADPAGVTSQVVITDGVRISQLRVEVNITHPYIGDLKVTLTNGTATQVLHANEGGSADDLHRTFDTLGFQSASSAGPWTLQVVNSARQDVGRLDSWKLIVTGTPN